MRKSPPSNTVSITPSNTVSIIKNLRRSAPIEIPSQEPVKNKILTLLQEGQNPAEVVGSAPPQSFYVGKPKELLLTRKKCLQIERTLSDSSIPYSKKDMDSLPSPLKTMPQSPPVSFLAEKAIPKAISASTPESPLKEVKKAVHVGFNFKM